VSERGREGGRERGRQLRAEAGQRRSSPEKRQEVAAPKAEASHHSLIQNLCFIHFSQKQFVIPIYSSAKYRLPMDFFCLQ